MPRLGFAIVGQAPSLFLPLKARAIHGGGWKRSAVRAGVNLAGRFLIPSDPGDVVRHIPVGSFSDDLLAVDGLPGFHACPDRAFFEWQDKRQDIGHFLPLAFVNRQDQPIGWCFARVAEEDAPGCLVGRILETTFFPRSNMGERSAMMQHVVRALASAGVGVIRALTTCPDTITSLRKLHFRSGRLNPAMVYLNGLDLGNAPPRISVLRADGGILPLPYSLARYEF